MPVSSSVMKAVAAPWPTSDANHSIARECSSALCDSRMIQSTPHDRAIRRSASAEVSSDILSRHWIRSDYPQRPTFVGLGPDCRELGEKSFERLRIGHQENCETVRSCDPGWARHVEECAEAVVTANGKG